MERPFPVNNWHAASPFLKFDPFSGLGIEYLFPVDLHILQHFHEHSSYWCWIHLKFLYPECFLILIPHIINKANQIPMRKDQNWRVWLSCGFTFWHYLMLIINFLIYSSPKMNAWIKIFLTYRKWEDCSLWAVSDVSKKQRSQCNLNLSWNTVRFSFSHCPPILMSFFKS